MGLLDSVLGALANSQPGVQPPAPGATQGVPGSVLLSTVIAMLANGQQAQGAGVGGVGDLIGRFTRGGLGDVIGGMLMFSRVFLGKSVSEQIRPTKPASRSRYPASRSSRCPANEMATPGIPRTTASIAAETVPE